jgi:hypothetical protein
VCGPYAENFIIFYNNIIETAYLPKDSTIAGWSFLLDVGLTFSSTMKYPIKVIFSKNTFINSPTSNPVFSLISNI